MDLSASSPPDSTVRMLTEDQLRQCVGLDRESLGVIEDAFSALWRLPVSMPPIQHIGVQGSLPTAAEGDVDIKSAFIPGLDRLAVKIASGFAGNRTWGLPSGSGLMVALDCRTGFCRAVLLDNGFLTDLRTALAGAVAADHLAPKTVDTAAVLGTGRQAELQARSLHLVRPFRRLLIYGRNPAAAHDLGQRLAGALPEVTIEVTDSPAGAVKESQCLVTTTAARQPLVAAQWLHPGQHITAMGSDLPGKQELEPEVLAAADLCVFDRRSQCRRLGELQHVQEDQLQQLNDCELGEITSGEHPGRTDQHQITVCDLTGTGVQDTAIAVHALRRAETLGLGQVISGNHGQ